MDPFRANANYLSFGFQIPQQVSTGYFNPPGTNVPLIPNPQERVRTTPSAPAYGGDDANAIRESVHRTGRLWEDSSFPAQDSSLFPTKPFAKRVIWKRPHDIVRNPKFFVDGASRFDVKQGELGDCWLLAAVSNLTLHPSLFSNIVSQGQSFDQNYCGFFTFRFWWFGDWVNVIVDDRLPTIDGKLAFMSSADGNEFWSALFEKAYAKLHGSYEALSGGRPSTAMDDFTGGVSEIFDLRSRPPNLFEIMLKGFERGSLMACSMEPNPHVLEQRCTNGLIKGHAYSITCVKYCEVNTPRSRERIPLIRVRNPWGNEAEWNGPWSDKSPEWRYVSQDERYNMGLTFEHDGEFWISYSDFVSNFDAVEMTNINLESMTEKDLNNHVKHRWEVKKFEGSWVRGVSAGGCANHPRTFWNNPKFFVTLKEEDDGDRDMKCTMLVALLQKPRKGKSSRTGKKPLLTIGFSVYPVPPTILRGGSLNIGALKTSREIKGIPAFVNHRQVSFRFHLEPGTYCIIPSTYNPDEEASFLLRVFFEKPNTVEEGNVPIGFVGLDSKVISPTVQPPNPDGAEAKMKTVFDQIAGADGEIDWKELQILLNKRFMPEFKFGGFGKDACRSMVAMLDSDRSGKLCLAEFVHLMNIVTIWKTAFQKHDRDASGSMSGFEFRDALLTSGFQISNDLFVSLMTSYADGDRNVTFDDFVLCAIRMSNSLKSFTAKDTGRTGSATFTLEEYMRHTVCS